MDRRKIAGLGALVALLAAVACKEPFDVGSFSVADQWSGTIKLQVSGTDSAAYNFVLDLEQDRSSVSGSGTIQHGAETVEASVAGVWNYPTVHMLLTAPGYAPLDYLPQFVTRDTLRGPLTGSGFEGTTLTIVRQP